MCIPNCTPDVIRHCPVLTVELGKGRALCHYFEWVEGGHEDNRCSALLVHSQAQSFLVLLAFTMFSCRFFFFFCSRSRASIILASFQDSSALAMKRGVRASMTVVRKPYGSLAAHSTTYSAHARTSIMLSTAATRPSQTWNQVFCSGENRSNSQNNAIFRETANISWVGCKFRDEKEGDNQYHNTCTYYYYYYY